jgi:hypothetical protein
MAIIDTIVAILMTCLIITIIVPTILLGLFWVTSN